MNDSPKNNAIFIHIARTAGTSMEEMGYFEAPSFVAKTIFDVKAEMESSVFNNAYKFAFVRNPWDRFISGYFKSSKYRNYLGGLSISQAISNLKSHGHIFSASKHPRKAALLFRSQYKYICDNAGNILVDFVGRFENLMEDWRVVCNKLGVKSELGHHHKTEHKYYKEYFTPELRKAVGEVYKKDIEIFNYEF